MSVPLLPLRPFQDENIRFAIARSRVIIADDPGLGKTRTGLQTAALWYDTAAPRSLKRMGFKMLIVTGRSGLNVWRAEDRVWTNLGIKLVHGKPSDRFPLWDNPVVATTYQTLQKDYEKIPFEKRQWDVVILDEIHKFKNRKTDGFKLLQQVCASSTYLMLLTGSPASRGNQDYWGYLNLLDNKLFSSYWKFIHEYCEIDNTPFGMQIVDNKNTQKLYKMLALKYMRRTSKSEAGTPPKIKSYLPVTMEASQKRGYNQLVNDLLLDLRNFENTDFMSFLKVPSKFALAIRLRQWLVSPRLLSPGAPIGAAITGLKDWLLDQPDDELDSRHVVIFTPFAKAIPLIKSSLLESFHDSDTIYTLQGGASPDEVKVVEEGFRATPRSIVICTIKFAQSFSLETAKAGLFVGEEWDPQENIQAEDRISRLTSKGSALIYYIRHEDTYEDHLFDILDGKAERTTQLTNMFKNRRSDMASVP